MGNLMTQHDGQRGLVLSDGEEPLVNHDFSAGHTEGIGLVFGEQVELPLETAYPVGKAVLRQIGVHGIGEPLPHPLHHRRIGGIGRQLGCHGVLLIFVECQSEHLFIGIRKALFASGDGHHAGGAATGQDDSDQRNE